MAVSLLKKIQYNNKLIKIKTQYFASTVDGGDESEYNILRTYKSVLGVVGGKYALLLQTLTGNFLPVGALFCSAAVSGLFT